MFIWMKFRWDILVLRFLCWIVLENQDSFLGVKSTVINFIFKVFAFLTRTLARGKNMLKTVQY
jgi:hypothetical protein